jgi:hypothetical protein
MSFARTAAIGAVEPFLFCLSMPGAIIFKPVIMIVKCLVVGQKALLNASVQAQ